MEMNGPFHAPVTISQKAGYASTPVWISFSCLETDPSSLGIHPIA